MSSFNKVILMGNLTRDPQVRHTTGGAAVCDIGLAVTRSWYDKSSNSRKEETTFVDVTLWGKTAEIASEYLKKGRSVLIEGRLQLDQWGDKQTGQKRSKLKVVGENMTMLGGRGDQQPLNKPIQNTEGEDSFPEDDVPFQKTNFHMELTPSEREAMARHIAESMLTEPLSVKELAGLFGVNRNKMAYILKGHLPGAIKIRGLWRVPVMKMPPQYFEERNISVFDARNCKDLHS